MNLRELKELLNNIPDDKLDQEAIVISQFWDGSINKVETLEEDLYWNGDDDPSELMSKEKLIKQVLFEGEVMPNPYIKKGSIVFKV